MRASNATHPHAKTEPTISKTIVEMVAEAEGIAPTELDTCLYDVIEPEALNELFQPEDDGPATEGVVSFTFHGYTVTVHSDSSVEIDLVKT